MLNGLKAIDAGIAKVAKTGDAFNALVSECIISIIAHAQAHGDCSRALALVNAMPASVKREAVIASFRDYSPIGISVKNQKFGLHKEGSKMFRAFDLEGYRANPWFSRQELAVELPDTTLELADKAVMNLANRFQKRLDEGKVAANDVKAVTARITSLKALAKAA